MSYFDLIRISRPRFWLYLAGPYLLGFLFGGGSLLSPSLFLFVTLFFFLVIANIYLYGVNDLFDRDTDANNPKKNQKEHLLQTTEIRSLQWVLFVCLWFSLIVLCLLPNRASQGLFLVYLVLATFYSAPPFRFKSKPFIDSLSNVLYAFPAFIAYTSLTGEMVSASVVLLSLCWTAAMHLYSAIPDITADKRASLLTTAVLLGEKKSLLLCSFLWAVFAFLVIQSKWFFPFSLLSCLYAIIPLWVLFRKKDVEKVYWFFPFINMTMGFIAFLSFYF